MAWKKTSTIGITTKTTVSEGVSFYPGHSLPGHVATGAATGSTLAETEHHSEHAFLRAGDIGVVKHDLRDQSKEDADLAEHLKGVVGWISVPAERKVCQ